MTSAWLEEHSWTVRTFNYQCAWLTGLDGPHASDACATFSRQKTPGSMQKRLRLQGEHLVGIKIVLLSLVDQRLDSYREFALPGHNVLKCPLCRLRCQLRVITMVPIRA